MALKFVNYIRQQHGSNDSHNHKQRSFSNKTNPSKSNNIERSHRHFHHYRQLSQKQTTCPTTGGELVSKSTISSTELMRTRYFRHLAILSAIHLLLLPNIAVGQLVQRPQIYNSYNNELAKRPYQLRRNPRYDSSSFSEQRLDFNRRQDSGNLNAFARQQGGVPLPQPASSPVLVAPQIAKRQLREHEVISQIVLPDENYSRASFNASQFDEQLKNSYVIDHKRFVEAVSTRCWASTILEDPAAVEPSFIIIKPSGEVRVNATAPIELIKQVAGFEPQKKTTIVVHGFTQSYPSTSWLRRTRALFEVHSLVGRHNLIIMDWGIASSGSYSQVAAMVSGMGSFLANFIMKLIDLGADRMSIHVIGHSLGAHLAGFAGKRIRPRLGRITALDPAGPCFGKIFSNSPSDRLSPGDAFEVDVYHYDDDFLGLPGQHGQFDIYVNGGSSQPGCTDNMNTMFQALITMLFRRNRNLSESHTRSTEVATAQLSATGCQQVAYECRDYPAFASGECGKCDETNSQCFLMGFDFQYGELGGELSALRTSFPGKRFYILTGDKELFCSNHYQILIRFEPSNELSLARRNKWRLNVELIGDQPGVSINTTIINQMAPNVFSYLLLTESRPIRIRSARLHMISSDGVPVLLQQQPFKNSGSLQKSAIKAAAIEVNFMSNINPQVRRSLSSRLCPVSWILPSGPPPFADSNAISDWPGKAGEGWLQFDECFFSGPPV